MGHTGEVVHLCSEERKQAIALSRAFWEWACAAQQ